MSKRMIKINAKFLWNWIFLSAGFGLFMYAKTAATKSDTIKSTIGKATPKETKMLVTNASMAIKIRRVIKKFIYLVTFFSKATLAAACSAFFLLGPDPVPNMMPLKLTWKVKFLSCAGPLSSILS